LRGELAPLSTGVSPTNQNLRDRIATSTPIKRFPAEAGKRSKCRTICQRRDYFAASCSFWTSGKAEYIGFSFEPWKVRLM